MKTDNGSNNKVFAFPGSTTHHMPVLPFTIDHMILKIKPDFESKILPDCEEFLQITAKNEVNELEFDIAEMKIEKVISSNVPINNTKKKKDDNTMELQFSLDLLYRRKQM